MKWTFGILGSAFWIVNLFRLFNDMMYSKPTSVDPWFGFISGILMIGLAVILSVIEAKNIPVLHDNVKVTSL